MLTARQLIRKLEEVDPDTVIVINDQRYWRKTKFVIADGCVSDGSVLQLQRPEDKSGIKVKVTDTDEKLLQNKSIKAIFIR